MIEHVIELYHGAGHRAHERFHQIAKLVGIAVPGQGRQDDERGTAETLRGQSKLLAGLSGEVNREERNVVATSTERRHLEPRQRKAIDQLSTEAAILD